MRTFARIAGGAMAAAVLFLVAPVPASAGGPTSVLLVSPGRQATASLYTTDEAYQRLERLVVPNPTADPAAPNLQGGPGSEAINVTWLMHDVRVWRVDRIFVDAQGGPWIETRITTNGDNVDWERPAVLHRSAEPKALIALLSALRLVGSSPAPDAAAGPKASEPVTQPVQQAPAVQPVASQREVADLNWLWLLIGAAAGAVLVIGFRPLVRRLRQPASPGI